MRREKSPRFPFDARDWLADGRVAALSLEAEGAYIRLLAVCWLERWIPSDATKLARLLRCSRARAARLWRDELAQFFVRVGDGADVDRWTNPRLEVERMEATQADAAPLQDEAAARRSARGAAAAAVRWAHHRTRVAREHARGMLGASMQDARSNARSIDVGCSEHAPSNARSTAESIRTSAPCIAEGNAGADSAELQIQSPAQPKGVRTVLPHTPNRWAPKGAAPPTNRVRAADLVEEVARRRSVHG